MATHFTMVLTTIRYPAVLLDYAKNAARFNHEDVRFIVIGDRQTPAELYKLSAQLEDLGYEASYYGIQEQKGIINRFPSLDGIIPYDSDCRRNLGYLIAAEKGTDVIISIDDDNFPVDDYFKLHEIVTYNHTFPAAVSENGWFNPCSLLQVEPSWRIYSRGFPYSKRWTDCSKVEDRTEEGRVVLNLGLWLGSPDVDAITNLARPTKVVGIKHNRVMLARNTFTPINTQNTALALDLLPCFYYVPMGAMINGVTLDRYGDIWTGIFANKIINHIRDRICIGRPLTDHRRNVHNLFKDLMCEIWGMILTNYLVNLIIDCEIYSKNYADAYLELADELAKRTSTHENADVKKYFRKLSKAMYSWVNVCQAIL